MNLLSKIFKQFQTYSNIDDNQFWGSFVVLCCLVYVKDIIRYY